MTDNKSHNTPEIIDGKIKKGHLMLEIYTWINGLIIV